MHLRVRCRSFVVAALALLFLIAPSAALAENYDVTAKVMAPLPPNLPVLLTPANNSVQVSDTVLITGSCPIVVPTLIVVLVRFDQTIGSGSCDSLVIFRVSVALVLGVNIIQAKFMTITGESTGYTQLIKLTYLAPAVPKPNTAPAPDSKPAAQSLELLLDKDNIIIKTKDTTTVGYTIMGGVGPYVLEVDWGDGQTQTVYYDTAGYKALGHIYVSISSRPMRLAMVLKDANVAKAVQERAVVSFEKPASIPTKKSSGSGFTIKSAAIWASAATASVATLAAVYNVVYLNKFVHPPGGHLPTHAKPKVKLRGKK